jgi:hypothetical protein
MEQELGGPGVRFHSLSYKALCQESGRVMDEICSQVQRMGYAIQPVDADFAPLHGSRGPQLPPDMLVRSSDYLSAFQKG